MEMYQLIYNYATILNGDVSINLILVARGKCVILNNMKIQYYKTNISEYTLQYSTVRCSPKKQIIVMTH